MSGEDDDAGAGRFASPPCFMHELDEAFMNPQPVADHRQEVDVKRWRKEARARLIEERLALSADIRLQLGERIAAHLEDAMGAVEGLVVSLYWPFRGEPDLRALMQRIGRRGGRCALPVVVALGEPLFFRAWGHGDPLTRGVWNIPIPPEGAEIVTPDIVIAPVIGFDRQGYRLGYGGGFYDRTLAALAGTKRVFGVGYDQAAIPTIYPQWHDIKMDAVITESGAVAADAPAAG